MKKRTKDLDSRVTFSLPQTDHEYLRLLAQEKRVSIGWVVREAVRTYLRDTVNKAEGSGSTYEQSLF
jgi:hypothetical protein